MYRSSKFNIYMNRCLKVGLCFFLLIVLSACGNMMDLKKANAKFSTYLSDIPEEFNNLDVNLKKGLKIFVSVRNKATNERIDIKLDSKNKFRSEMYLMPGEYKINQTFINSAGILPFDVEIEKNTFKIVENSETKIPLKFSNSEKTIKEIEIAKPSEEILKVDKFDTVLQIGGKLVDMKNIFFSLAFEKPAKPTLEPDEERKIYAKNLGLYATVKNTTSKPIEQTKASLKELVFFDSNIVLPKGVRVGSKISEIAHKETGAFGLPDELTGTPLLSAGFGETRLVYTDKNTKTRIIFIVDSNENFIREIKYEFNRNEAE